MTQVQPNTMDMEELPATLVFHTTFRPILRLMKISGLCPRIPNLSKPNGNKRLATLSLLYSVVVVLMILFHIARTVPYLHFNSSFELYLRMNIIVWFFRNFAFSIYLMRITASGDERASRLQCIIRHLDDDIDGSLIKTNKKPLKKFKFRVKLTTCLVFIFIAFTILFGCIMIFTQFDSGMIATTLMLPFEGNFAFKVIFNLSNIYMIIIWLVPMLLYSTMCSSLVMKLSFLGSNLNSFCENSNIKQSIKLIRVMFLNVTSIVSKADDLFGPVALFIYFFDIILFSVTLYGSLFIAKSTFELFNLSFWCFVSVLNLVVVSIEAASVEEKGKEVIDLLQKFEATDADHHTQLELSLLMFHLSGEPIKMTIWKLIPLYKSILVSVFISLITYFTLLVQFK